MKFTNGFWLTREGVSLNKAVQLQAVDKTESSVDLLYATRHVEHRGQTLNIGTINLSIDAAADDVIRVRAIHHKGAKSPLKFPLAEGSAKTKIDSTENSLSFRSRNLSAVISKTDFAIEWRGHGKPLANQTDKGIFYTSSQDGRHISAQMPIGVGEQIYGLGERFTSFVKNGQSVDIYNEDPGTSSEQAYKNIPFYISNKGYGVFVNHTGRVSFEVGSETVNKVQFTVAGEELEYLVIYGPTPKEILSKYTALTGRAPLLPKWSFGLWLSTSFVTDYDEKTVRSFIEGMRERDIPLSVFHFDCFWMREYQWCDFQWDARVFPDPAAMLSRLKNDGLKISLWINPYIGQASPLFTEAAELGYLLKRADGSFWQWDLWQAGNAIVDFTNPGARKWFQSKLRPLLEMGVDCFKTDFGERIPTDVVYFDGSNPEQMHNLYTQVYNETVWEILHEYRKEDAILFARSATAGGQKMPVHWGGDNTSTFESMAESLRGGLSLGLSGFGYWAHDIGGFEGKPDDSVFKRWIPFGLLSSHSRLHGNESVRVPWAFGEEAVSVTRKFTKLKASLMPYIYKTAKEVTEFGTPMMRAMLLEFPEDKTCETLDQQYMLGSSLLVAPVFNAEGNVQFYLPKGNWSNFFTKQVVEGGRWITEQHGFDSIPLYVREGHDIETGRDDTFDYEF
jgi:alpha-D-xyloside xylohydrolase